MALSTDYDFVESLPRNKPSQQKQDQQQQSQQQRQQYYNEQNKQYQQYDKQIHFQQQDMIPQKDIPVLEERTLQQLQQQQFHQQEVKQQVVQEQLKQQQLLQEQQQQQQQKQQQQEQRAQEQQISQQQQQQQLQQLQQQQQQQQRVQEQQNQRIQDQQQWIHEQKLQQQQWIQEQQQQQQLRFKEQQQRMQEEQQKLQQQLQMHHQQRIQEQQQQQQYQQLQMQHQQRIQEQFLQQQQQQQLLKAIPGDQSNNLNAQARQKSSEKDKFILPLGTGSPDAPPDVIDSAVHSSAHVSGRMNGDSRSREERARRERDDDSSPNSEDSPIRQERPSRWKMSRDEGDLLKKERNKLLTTLSSIKRKITEVEQQEEELLRGLEMERALLEGEWAAQRDRSLQDEARLTGLRSRVCRLDGELERGRAREIARQNECRQRLETAATEMQRLEQEVMRSAGCPDRQREIADRLQHQHDLLEAEKKTFEDLEFRHLEEEAGWLAAREEAQRDAAEVGARAAERRSRLAVLEQQRRAAACAAQQEGHSLQRILAEELARLEETRNQLRVVEARLEELTQHGIISSQESSADASSDVDEPAATSPSTSLPSPQSPQSQDDLARISRVTMGAPLDVNTGSLGRKALASLKEIERNRQLHLAQQGSQVIEEERKRVQELKRRVQDEVRAQWEERRQQQQQQRGAHCASLNSVGSDEASLTSSDVPTESASSDDALEKRIPSGITSGVNGANAASTVNGSSGNNEKSDADQTDSQLQASVREKELELERDYDETRPLSDAAAYERQLTVRMREKASRLQRPLTRYLPIRGAGLDLRAHVESAGHQVELCAHVAVDAATCRGPLHKLGSRFHHWNKRWFVFDRSKRTLMYFADRAEKKPRGGAFFQSIEEVYVDHLNSVKSPNPQLTFVVKTVERTYHLMAPSAEAMRIWVDVIFTGAEGYQEFEAGT